MSSPKIPEEKMEMKRSHDSLKVPRYNENILRLEPLFLTFFPVFRPEQADFLGQLCMI